MYVSIYVAIYDRLMQIRQAAGDPGHVLAPIPEFLAQSFFSTDVVHRSLKPDGLLAVNVVGPASHRAAVHASLSGCVLTVVGLSACGVHCGVFHTQD